MKRKKDDRIGTEVDITIDSIGTEGVSVGRLDGIVYFVRGALPGEQVRAKIVRSHRRHLEAEAVQIQVASSERTQPVCPEFGVCGGCKWQHLEYFAQTTWKRQHVVDAFERIANMKNIDVREIVTADKVYGYRNKMEFSFGASKWLTSAEIESGETFETDFALGLHVPGRFDKVRDVERCYLQSDLANTLLKFVRDLTESNPLPAYHPRSHDGFLRNLVLRSSMLNNNVMAMLITTSVLDDVQQSFVDAWMKCNSLLPEGSTVIHAVSDSWSPVAVGEIMQQIGPGFLREKTHDVEFNISPFSFFQTNTLQLPKLVSLALAAAEIDDADCVWDLYCGTGTLSLPAAGMAKHVVGVELSASSIDDAESNAQLNSINNVEFHALDLHSKKAISYLTSLPKPDVVIIDPPRSGMHPQVVEHLLELGPSRISYVSCNPATQARDCQLLSEKYEVVFVTPVDMFPQTHHVEAVAMLRLKPIA
ncbi:MAG: 23S rRNA (uracil(1939)-C(5))-methyltransferase RlmD [Ignavibacteria bacterium]|nr:23S rRNA (uracil(1939)-C(5))-methyltransferase RlmD [Ignavibacteria bacterium]